MDYSYTQNLLQSLIISTMILVATSFSLWYSSKLALFKNPSFKYSFFSSLVAFLTMGFFRIGIYYLSPDFKGGKVLISTLLVGFIILFFSIKLFFRESNIKTLITTFLTFLVSIIIVIPLLVSAGFLMTYFSKQN